MKNNFKKIIVWLALQIISITLITGCQSVNHNPNDNSADVQYNSFNNYH